AVISFLLEIAQRLRLISAVISFLLEIAQRSRHHLRIVTKSKIATKRSVCYKLFHMKKNPLR
ncbi:hypothetical protein, partial [Aquibacillus kalidii]|uniref:hypothetical protein n=1 Tax=Aquibacillus kalidii TaxID=2762597 RepID=UPI001C9962B9